MTAEVKRVLLEKGKVYDQYVKNGRRDQDYGLLLEAQAKCRKAVKDAKKLHFSNLANSLNNPGIG